MTGEGMTGKGTVLVLEPAEFSRTIHDMNNSLGNLIGGLELLVSLLHESPAREISADAFQAALDVARHARTLQDALRR